MAMKRGRSKYIRPEITRIDLDSSITLVMMTVGNPDPRGDTRKSPSQDPFSSPFNDKPFG